MRLSEWPGRDVRLARIDLGSSRGRFPAMCRAQPALNPQRVGLSRTFKAAERCDTNLVAALVCPDDHSLYEDLTGEMTDLGGSAFRQWPSPWPRARCFTSTWCWRLRRVATTNEAMLYSDTDTIATAKE